MKIANALERELTLEAVIRIEAEEKTPRIAAIRRDETEILMDSVNRLVQMSVGDENNARSSEGRRDNSHLWGTRPDGNRHSDQGSRDWARTPIPGPNKREKNDNDKLPLCGQKD